MLHVAGGVPSCDVSGSPSVDPRQSVKAVCPVEVFVRMRDHVGDALRRIVIWRRSKGASVSGAAVVVRLEEVTFATVCDAHPHIEVASKDAVAGGSVYVGVPELGNGAGCSGGLGGRVGRGRSGGPGGGFGRCWSGRGLRSWLWGWFRCRFRSWLRGGFGSRLRSRLGSWLRGRLHGGFGGTRIVKGVATFPNSVKEVRFWILQKEIGVLIVHETIRIVVHHVGVGIDGSTGWSRGSGSWLRGRLRCWLRC
mmetsp:Transcript_22943/g.40940  ORF Transcript_22943/g.40940 Transcript_22943/m.40940 type:complete len:251 (-) Transcript_22943:414-1166(-)